MFAGPGWSKTQSGTRPTVNTDMKESQGPESGRYMLLGPRPANLTPPGRARCVLAWLLSGRVSDGWVFAAGYAILLPFFLAPLFATRLLPGLDLPFHIAAADLLSKVGDPSSPYAPYYDGGLRMAPYAAHFLALAMLGKVIGLLAAHKLIIVLYVAGLPLSAAWLLAACGRSRVPALLAFPLAYNLPLHYGFITFTLSLPVVLLLLAAMVKLAFVRGRRRTLWTWTLVAALAFLLFLCHLQNHLYGLCAGLAFAVLVPSTWRRKVLAALSLVPSLGGLAYWHLSSPPVAGQRPLTPAAAWGFLKHHRLGDVGNRGWGIDLTDRVRALPGNAMRAFVDEADVSACKALCLIMGVYAAVGLIGLVRRRSIGDGRTTRGLQLALAGAIAAFGAMLAYMALPHHLQELELMTFFPRFAVLVLLIALLLVPSGLLRLRGVLALLLPLPAVVLGIGYGHQLYLHYRAYGAEVAGFLKVMEKTPPGGKALGLVFDRKSQIMMVDSAVVGVPDFYPALRPAPGSMVPPAYCGLRHMPCSWKIPKDLITNPWGPSGFAPGPMLQIFDYFIVRSLPPRFDLFRGYHGMVDLLAASGQWAVFRKKPGPVLPDPPPPPALPVHPAPAQLIAPPVAPVASKAVPAKAPRMPSEGRPLLKSGGPGKQKPRPEPTATKHLP